MYSLRTPMGNNWLNFVSPAGLRILNGTMKNDILGKITCYQPGKDNTVGFIVVRKISNTLFHLMLPYEHIF